MCGIRLLVVGADYYTMAEEDPDDILDKMFEQVELVNRSEQERVSIHDLEEEARKQGKLD